MTALGFHPVWMKGTNAERLALTTTGIYTPFFFYETDTDQAFSWNGSAWIDYAGDQYLLLAGRSGGQTAYGGTDSGDDLTLYSTSHATKGTISLGGVLMVDSGAAHIFNTYTSDVVGLAVYETTLSVTDTFAGVYVNVTKTAGNTDASDHMYGGYFAISYDDTGQAAGSLYGSRNYAQLVDGTVEYIYPVIAYADVDGGTVNNKVILAYALYNQAAGTVTDDLEGIRSYINQDAGEVGGDVKGLYVWMDLDGTVNGTSYMIYLEEYTGVDYGIYQNGTADNYLGGKLGVGVECRYDTWLDVKHSTPSSGAYASDYLVALFDAENARVQIMSSDQGNWGSALHLTTADKTFSLYQPDEGTTLYFGYDTQAADNENISSDSSVLLALSSTGNLVPGGNKTQDIGAAATAWDDAYADDFNNVADFPFLDEYDDIGALRKVKPLGQIDPKHRLPLVDDDSLPEWLLLRDDRNEVVKDSDGKPYIPLKIAIGWLMGISRDLDNRLMSVEQALN